MLHGHGHRVDARVSNLQIAPTVARLLGVPFPASQVSPLPGFGRG